MEKSFKSCESNDPNEGFTRFGNFHNYYTFYPAEHRIKLLPDYLKHLKGIEDKLFCLDVGCNVGVSIQNNVYLSGDCNEPPNWLMMLVTKHRRFLYTIFDVINFGNCR